MSFEAGLAVMCSLMGAPPGHTYFIFERDSKRLQKSLSDLGGTDVYAHGGSAERVLREISHALIAAKRRPTVEQMLGYLG
jgi:cytochrome P450